MASRLILRGAQTQTPKRGIRIKKRVTRFLHRIFRRHRYCNKVNAVSRIFHRFRRFLKFGPGSGYGRLGRVRDEPVTSVPKGHLAVYVGGKEEQGWSERVLVPVVYINHPLFGRLLRDAEEKYGFDHEGGITIPCHVSEFESVQSKIARDKLLSSSRWC